MKIARVNLFNQARGRAVTLQAISVDVSARRVATVLLNRPDRGNAFDQHMLDELATQLAAFANDDNVRVVMLRGNGRHFCTGADLIARGTEAPSAELRVSLVDVLAALDALPKPTVAVVHGGAVGGGAAIAACCDIVIATEGAFFSIPEIRVGMAPLGVTPFLIRAMGHRNFRRYALSGERITAAEAHRVGLAHEICGTARLDEKLARIADDLLHAAPGAVGELKRAWDRHTIPSLASIMVDRPVHHGTQSPEAREGVASFREKRKPTWYPE